MRTAGVDLTAHLEGECTTLATCWQVTLVDGTLYGFTDYIADLTFGGQTYLAATGFNASAITGNADLSIDNLEAIGVLESETLDRDELIAGRWDYAAVSIFLVNYLDLTQGALVQHSGHLGELSLQRGSFAAELRGLVQAYTRRIGRIELPTCDADLGDARCKADLTNYTRTGTVSSIVIADREFVSNLPSVFIQLTPATQGAPTEDYFNNGKLTWLTGENAGLSMEIKDYQVDGTVRLQLPMTYPVVVGDTFSAVAGCRKRFEEDCIVKFGNYLNFRGSPNVPGQDSISG